MIRPSIFSIVFSTLLLLASATASGQPSRHSPARQTNPTGDAVPNTALNALECRCGMAQFLTLPHAVITPRSKALQCAGYKLIDARGTSERPGVSTMFYATIQNILAEVPHGVSLPVEYPAGPDQNTTSGEEFVLNIINRGLKRCPNQKYALFGYSQGASLMLKVLERLSCESSKAIASIILVGNPYRVPGKESNFNGTAQHDDRQTIGIFATTALAQNSSVPQFSPEIDKSGKARDFCLEDDTVCASNPDCPCQIPAGHLSYGAVDVIQQTAFDHVVSRLTNSTG